MVVEAARVSNFARILAMKATQAVEDNFVAWASFETAPAAPVAAAFALLIGAWLSAMPALRCTGGRRVR